MTSSQAQADDSVLH